MTTFNLMDAIDSAVEVGPDMNEAVKGGGKRELPAAGPCRVRLVSYIELGIHVETSGVAKGKKKEKVYTAWEISGPKHPPKEDGTPHILGRTLTLSLNEKANFYKEFITLNYDKSAKLYAQLLGKPFLADITHDKSKTDETLVYANLKNIRPPFRVNEDDENVPVTVAPAITTLKCFMWNAPKMLKEMWDSIFIDGMWDAIVKDGVETSPARSKNYFQNLIRRADNFKGSPIAALVGEGGGEVDLGMEAERPERTEVPVEGNASASDDPLAGMM
jgi:hypothetical protein